MYQAIVIDDEKWVVKSLIATIRDQEYFEITAEFYDGLSGLEYIRAHEPVWRLWMCVCRAWEGWISCRPPTRKT